MNEKEMWPFFLENREEIASLASSIACEGRQFKNTKMHTLIVPQNYPYQLLMPEAIIHNITTY